MFYKVPSYGKFGSAASVCSGLSRLLSVPFQSVSGLQCFIVVAYVPKVGNSQQFLSGVYSSLLFPTVSGIAVPAGKGIA